MQTVTGRRSEVKFHAAKERVTELLILLHLIAIAGVTHAGGVGDVLPFREDIEVARDLIARGEVELPTARPFRAGRVLTTEQQLTKSGRAQSFQRMPAYTL